MTSGRNSSAVMGQPAQSPHLILGGMPVTDHCFNTIPSLPLDVIMTSLMTSKVSGGNCTPTHTGSSKKMCTGTPSWVHTHAPLYTQRYAYSQACTHTWSHPHGHNHTCEFACTQRANYTCAHTEVCVHVSKGVRVQTHAQSLHQTNVHAQILKRKCLHVGAPARIHLHRYMYSSVHK